jgi:2-dehydro-3-deoxy-L-rhamnonate dehydrogenase (NAD+)
MIDLRGRTSLVTGAASGIGLACAEMLGAAGARVALADIDLDAAKARADSIEGAIALHVDVTDDDGVAAMVADAVKEFGSLDLAVNNAGVGSVFTPLAEIDTAEWDRLDAVFLRAMFVCLREEVRQMSGQAGSAAIVNVASMFGLVGVGGLAPYVSFKHGVAGLTRSAALELAPQGIRINAVAPGVIRTPIHNLTQEQLDEMAAEHPLKRIGEAHEVASLVGFLLSDEASFCVGGLYPVDGGYTAA